MNVTTKSLTCLASPRRLLLLTILAAAAPVIVAETCIAAEPGIVSDADAVPFKQVTIDSDCPPSPWSKITGDIDGDGLTDMVVGGHPRPLVWYKYPTWRRSVISLSGYDTVNGSAADMDGDGDTDIVMGSLVWFENPAPQGDPALLRWRQHPIGKVKTHDVEVGDLDGDGLPDLVSRNQSRFGHGDGDRFHIWRQVSADKWTQRTISCPHGEGIKLHDIDKDGDLDVVIAAHWYENTGDIAGGSWTDHVYTDRWTHGDAMVALADINDDGRTDLVLTPAEFKGEYYRIAWYECPKMGALGTWTEHIIVPKIEAVCHSLRLADINGDGMADVITAEMHQGRDPDEVMVYFNGDKGDRWTKQVLSNRGSHGIVVADFDGDGDIDVMGANHADDRVTLWENQTKQPPKKVLSLDRWRRHLVDKLPDDAIYVTGADLDGDGQCEIISGNWWYSSKTAAGPWQRHEISSESFSMAAVFDFDQDGHIDILGTRGKGARPNCEFVLAHNGGDGTFTVSETLVETKGDFLQGVAVARFYPGGPLQVALSWHKMSDKVQMLTSNGGSRDRKWSWDEIADISEDEDLSIGDIDGDGDADLLLGVKWLENPGESEGDKESKKWVAHTLGTTTGGLADRNALVDLDGDGRLDSVVGLEKGTDLLWYQGPKDPKQPWPRKIIAQNVGGGFSMDTADVDHDGDVDVVLGEHRQRPNNRVIIYENQDHASTWIPHVIDSSPHDEIDHHDGTQFVDIDGDGDLDIVSVGWYNPKVWLYENLAIER